MHIIVFSKGNGHARQLSIPPIVLLLFLVPFAATIGAGAWFAYLHFRPLLIPRSYANHLNDKVEDRDAGRLLATKYRTEIAELRSQISVIQTRIDRVSIDLASASARNPTQKGIGSFAGQSGKREVAPESIEADSRAALSANQQNSATATRSVEKVGAATSPLNDSTG